MSAVSKVKKLKTLPVGFICICVLPALLLVSLFTLYPLINALVMSFYSTTNLALGFGNFVGIDNYVRMFTNDQHFNTALRNTLQLMAVVPLVTVFLSMVFAFILTQSKLKERGMYRVVFFFPSVLSLVVIAAVWSALLAPTSRDPVNRVLGWFGGDAIMWLGDVRFALWAIAIVLIWQAVGYYMVLLLSSVDSINKEVFEAADLDGASGATKLFKITMPLIKDQIGICYVLSVSGTMALSFTLTFVMTNSGPGTATLVLLGHIFNTGFQASAFGYAMAIVVFSIVLALTLSAISRRFSYQSNV
ncbi:MAG: sugar ABC transporter permease [Firmicutes bacterium]|nr:sugar ABC transporter permease [Bacillota bacterium]